jgi:MFS family permease
VYFSIRNGAQLLRGPKVSSTVVLLGITSLLTDVSSEMVVAVLPIFLINGLGLSPLAFGFLDGLYQGATSFVRLLGGYLSDRWRSPKWVAAGGYLLSVVSRVILIPATSLTAVGTAIFTDRVGKGVRTGPRDALIATASSPDNLGKSFGVHRSLDNAGALAGPVVAFGVIAWLSRGALPTHSTFQTLFLVSLLFGVAGVAVLALLVPNLRAPAPPAPVRMRDALGLFSRGPLRRLIVAAAALGLVTVSDAFLYLTLADKNDLADAWFPLLYVGTAAAYLVLAVPIGRLADRRGRVRVWLGGYLALLAAYVVALLPVSGAAAVAGCVGLLGAYYSGTDGVLSAATAPLLPGELLASGMALMQTVVTVCRFLAAVVFGLIWTLTSQQTALVAFSVALVIVVSICAATLRRSSTRSMVLAAS